MSSINSSFSKNLLSSAFQAQNKMLKSAIRLSSGKRDDASSLAIAARMTNESRVAEIGAQNGELGISRLQQAGSSLNQAQGITQRLGELSARASDGTLNAADRSALNAEAQQLVQELQEMEANTTFNGQKILQGGSLSTHVDTTVSFEDANLGNVNGALAGLDLSTAAGAAAAMGQVDTAQQTLTNEQVKVSVQEAKLSRSVTSANNHSAIAAEASSTVGGIDLAMEVSKMIGAQVQHSAATSTISSMHKLEARTVKQLLSRR